MANPLPRWAAVYREDSSIKEPSTANSEDLLRMKSVRLWSQRLQHAEQQAWEDLCKPAFHDFQQLHNNKNDNDKDDSNEFSISLPLQYPLELLPCLILNPPPTCALDRQSMIHAFSSSAVSNRRTLTVVIPRVMQTLRQTVALIWRQILHQEPSCVLKNYAKKKLRSNKRSQSLQQWIYWWASQTEHFDQLVILLEDTGGFAQIKTRQDFYQAIAEWRLQGIPVSLVVMGTQEQVQDLSKFNVNISILSHLEDHQTSWIGRFFYHLIHPTNTSTRIIPPIDWNEVKELLQDYLRRHRSCSKLVQDLDQSIAHFYTQAGSFVWDLSYHNVAFVAWFCTYPNAKKIMEIKGCGWETYQALETCRQIQDQLATCWESITSSLPLFLEEVSPASIKQTLSLLAKLLGEADPTMQRNDQEQERFETLRRWLDPSQKRSVESTQVTDASSDDMYKKIRSLVRELIILVDAQGKAETLSKNPPDDETIQTELSKMIQNLYNLLGSQLDTWKGRWMNTCPLLLLSDNGGIFDKDVQPRYEIIEGLAHPAKALYQLLKGRLSIGRKEWLHDFGGSVADFTLGVWFLVVTGLLQVKRARGGQIVYEKVPVVWTS